MIKNMLKMSNIPKTENASARGRPAINYEDFDALCDSNYECAELNIERFRDVNHARDCISSSLYRYNKTSTRPYRLRLLTADNKLFVYKEKTEE